MSRKGLDDMTGFPEEETPASRSLWTQLRPPKNRGDDSSRVPCPWFGLDEVLTLSQSAKPPGCDRVNVLQAKMTRETAEKDLQPES